MPINKEMPTAVLEQKGMIIILIALQDYEPENPANITKLKQKTGLHNETIEAKVELLKCMSFVDEYRQKTIPCEHRVWLTERGRKLADILQQADEVLRQK